MAHRGRKNADDAIMRALLTGKTRLAAAKDAGVSPRTVGRRLADAEFAAKLRASQVEAMQQGVNALSSLMSAATETVAALLGSEDEIVRLRAAQAIFRFVVPLREHCEIEARLAALEDKAAKASEEPEFLLRRHNA
ncbi:MAG: hypothetical protein KDA61_21280 [Planctomycetales bacterium]|nr:hypothetical protein [Planctomycetales bacterium]